MVRSVVNDAECVSAGNGRALADEECALAHRQKAGLDSLTIQVTGIPRYVVCRIKLTRSERVRMTYQNLASPTDENPAPLGNEAPLPSVPDCERDGTGGKPSAIP